MYPNAPQRDRRLVRVDHHRNGRMALHGMLGGELTSFGLHLPNEVQPLIPALLMYGSTTFPTTGEWRIDGKLELEVRQDATSTCYWPLADCLPLALDSRWEVK